MSGRIVGEVLDYAPEDLKHAEFLVLIAVAEDARDKDRLARYSDVATLTRRTRLAPGTIRNALSTLARRALIQPQRDRIGPGGYHQMYVVAELHQHHRDATIRPLNGSPRNDENPPKRVTER